MEVEAWKKKVNELTGQLNAVVKEYDSILNEWADARDAARRPREA